MDQKDRFGDIMRRRERVEEDLYFAKHHPKASDSGSTEPMAAPLAEGSCPRCGVHLTPRVIRELEVHECTHCGGVWLDRAGNEPFPGSSYRSFLDYLEEQLKPD